MNSLVLNRQFHKNIFQDLLRYGECGAMSTGLQEALDCMLVVLKCVNDSMHQIAITGVPVSCSNAYNIFQKLYCSVY